MCDLSSVGAVPSTESTDTRYKIGGRLWRIGDSIYSTGTAVVEKDKMVETFGSQYENALVQGVLVGRGQLCRSYRVRWTSLAQPYEHEYAAQVFNNKNFHSDVASATTAEQLREYRREQVRTAMKKFRSDPSKTADEKSRENFRQRQEREQNSDSAIQRRQMDVYRKRKAKEKLKSEAAEELMREAARRKADIESETGFQAEAAALMKSGDRIRVVENGRLTSQLGQVKFVGKVPPTPKHHFYTAAPVHHNPAPFYIRILNHGMLAQVPGLAPGWWVGVQLDDSDEFAQGEIYDRSWGIVDGVRYFECERRSVASQPFSFHFHTPFDWRAHWRSNGRFLPFPDRRYGRFLRPGDLRVGDFPPSKKKPVQHGRSMRGPMAFSPLTVEAYAARKAHEAAQEQWQAACDAARAAGRARPVFTGPSPAGPSATAGV